MTAYYDLGQYSRPVLTKSSDAQAWFDRGLIWCYGYNHDEAVRCFRKAAEYDPACAMAHWGVSYAAGPNYNKQWKAFDPADLKRSLDTAYDAARRALELVGGASPVEQALIRPLAQRYPSNDPDKVTPVWNDHELGRHRRLRSGRGWRPQGHRHIRLKVQFLERRQCCPSGRRRRGGGYNCGVPCMGAERFKKLIDWQSVRSGPEQINGFG